MQGLIQNERIVFFYFQLSFSVAALPTIDRLLRLCTVLCLLGLGSINDSTVLVQKYHDITKYHSITQIIITYSVKPLNASIVK